jgi:hypothetical protein
LPAPAPLALPLPWDCVALGDGVAVGETVLVDRSVDALVDPPLVLGAGPDCTAGGVQGYVALVDGLDGRRECFTAGAGFGSLPGTMTDAASVRIVLDGPPLSPVPSSLMPRPTRAARSKDVPMATRADAESTPPPRARTRQLPFPRLSWFVGSADRCSVPPNG